MTRQETIDLPAGLKGARQRFEQWRRTRRKGARIPLALWNVAVKKAGQHGI